MPFIRFIHLDFFELYLLVRTKNGINHCNASAPRNGESEFGLSSERCHPVSMGNAATKLVLAL